MAIEEMLGEGFGVTALGRSGLRYREGSRTLVVDGEMLTGPFDFVVYSSSIKFWDDGRAVTDVEKKRILSNIEAVFSQQGLGVDFE